MGPTLVQTITTKNHEFNICSVSDRRPLRGGRPDALEKTGNLSPSFVSGPVYAVGILGTMVDHIQVIRRIKT